MRGKWKSYAHTHTHVERKLKRRNDKQIEIEENWSDEKWWGRRARATIICLCKYCHLNKCHALACLAFRCQQRNTDSLPVVFILSHALLLSVSVAFFYSFWMNEQALVWDTNTHSLIVVKPFSLLLAYCLFPFPSLKDLCFVIMWLKSILYRRSRSVATLYSRTFAQIAARYSLSLGVEYLPGKLIIDDENRVHKLHFYVEVSKWKLFPIRWMFSQFEAINATF